jgi:hypothetical protein
MNAKRFIRSATQIVAAGAGLAGVVYGVAAARAWWKYGNPSPPRTYERDELLDRFIPEYEVVERHRIWIAAPAEVVLDTAREQDLMESGLVRAIFKTREVVMGASPDDRPRPRGLLATVRSLGWGVLAELPGREVVVGAVTSPWEANVTFHALPPDQFARYREPGVVKIVWTLRARPPGDNASLFLTETRAIATDPDARARFRRYWTFVSPGVSSIRWLLLRPVKHDAERRARMRNAG